MFFVQCVLIDDNEWNRKLVKQKEKDPSRIDLLDEKDCRTLKFNGVILFDVIIYDINC